VSPPGTTGPPHRLRPSRSHHATSPTREFLGAQATLDSSPFASGKSIAGREQGGVWGTLSVLGVAARMAPRRKCNSLSLSCKLLVFLWYWNLNSGLWTCYAGALPLEPLCQPFWLSYFSDGILLCLGPASDEVLLPMAFSAAGLTGSHRHMQLIGWDGVLLAFCPVGLELRSYLSLAPK
jgi:hypothetical protein